MGFFDKFKKKKMEAANSNENINRASTDSTVNNEKPLGSRKLFEMDVETSSISENDKPLGSRELLELISGKFKSINIESNGDTLYFRDYDLSLQIRFGKQSSYNGRYTVQLLFILTHPFFDEELVESCAGIGSSQNEALTIATESFCAGVLTMILAALKCDGDGTVSIKIENEEHIFHVPCTRAVFHLGEKIAENMDMWKFIETEIIKYLGKKKAYWIKLYSAWIGGKLTCEARINGVMYLDLTEYLSKKIPKPSPTVSYGTDKQFILLIQKDETYKPCPYTSEHVFQLTYDAIEKMQQIDSKEKYEKTMDEIVSSAPIRSLGKELAVFIPEIYCQIILGIKDSDTVIAADPDSQKNLSLKKSQLSAYGFIERAVYSYINEKHPTKEQKLKVLYASSRFSAANQALMNGSKLENLKFTDLMYHIDSDYEIW